MNDAGRFSREVEQVSAEFEDRCRAGQSPAIREFLRRGPAELRSQLLQQLVQIDARYRRQRGGVVAAAEYVAAFPELAAVIEQWLPSESLQVAEGGLRGLAAGDVTTPLVRPGAGEDGISFQASNPAPGMRLGPYRLDEKLGAGGMGTVWRATHLRLEKTVALKLLAPQLLGDPALLTRFEREMKAVGRLDHPHLVRAYDAGDQEGVHFLAMEFIDGQDLSQYVRANGPLQPADAVTLLRQAAEGLAAAHRIGLVHRDIKPGNLMLTRDGQVKVTDLGLARLQADAASAEMTGITSVGQIIGTPDYMAPEQWDDGSRVDHSCDLYALGCTLFFLLAGRAPFATNDHPSLVSRMKAHVSGPIPDLRAVVPAVSPDLAALCARLMAKDPRDRYQSADELVAALRELTHGAATWRPQRAADASRPITAPASRSAVAALPPRLDRPVRDGSPADGLTAVTAAMSDTVLSSASRSLSDTSLPPAHQAGGGRQRSRRWMLLIGAIAVVAGGLSAFQLRDAQDPAERLAEPPAPRPPRTEVATPVASDDARRVIASPGVAAPSDPPVAETLPAPGSGESLEERTVRVRKLLEADNGSADRADGGRALLGCSYVQGALPSPAVLEALAGIPTLNSLFIGRVSSTATADHWPPEVIEALGALGGITSLGLYSARLTDRDLERLRFPAQLTSLELTYNPGVSERSAVQLGELSRLRNLTLEGNVAGDDGLRHLARLRELQYLSLLAAPVTSAGLSALQSLPNLRELKLESCQRINDSAVEVLGRFPQLCRLDLRGTQVSAEGAARLQALLPRCGILHASLPARPETLRVIDLLREQQGRAQSYASREFVTEAAPDEPLILSHVELRNRDTFTPELWSAVAACPSVTSVWLEGCGELDPLLQSLHAMSQLQRLVAVNGRGLTDAGLQHLSANRHLQTVMLNGTSLPTGTGGGEPLAFPQLRVLSANATGLDDDLLGRLAAGAPQLEKLQTSFNGQVGSRGVADLAQLSELRELHLERCSGIDDNAVGPLSKLQSLRYLNVMDTRLTPAGIAALRRALPQCYVDWERGQRP